MKGKIWREIRVLVVRNRGPYIGGPWAGWRIELRSVDTQDFHITTRMMGTGSLEIREVKLI